MRYLTLSLFCCVFFAGGAYAKVAYYTYGKPAGNEYYDARGSREYAHPYSQSASRYDDNRNYDYNGRRENDSRRERDDRRDRAENNRHPDRNNANNYGRGLGAAYARDGVIIQHFPQNGVNYAPAPNVNYNYTSSVTQSYSTAP